MSNDGETFFLGGVSGMIVGVAIGWYLHLGMQGNTGNGTLQHQQTAIDAGHAEWIVDQKTGERAFKWKEMPEWMEAMPAIPEA